MLSSREIRPQTGFQNGMRRLKKDQTMRAIHSRFLAPLGFIVAVLACPSLTRALDVERVEWGFDGRVVPMALNLVTIEVANNAATPFEGDVILQQGAGMARVDLPLIEKGLYIEAYGRRRLQFFPYINEVFEEYTLVWGKKPEERYPISSAGSPLRSGRPATVLLTDAGTLRLTRSRLATFADADFPVSVSGTDGLAQVVLDHVPRWDGLRLQAFRDWIGGGGRVHILQGATGEYPRFPAPLESLNDPSDVTQLGNGQVLHHPITIAGIDDQFVDRALGLQRTEGAQDRNRFAYQYQPSNSLAPLLRDLTRPDHNWGLIYVLSFAYLLVVFPGCWLLGRRRADFRISYPALLAAVFVFSMAFRAVGQRGYGEETAWNAVGTARRVAPGRFMTEQWSNAFVTTGDVYTFRHKGEGQIYSSGGSSDTRSGACFNRPAAGIETEIPPFSSQTILHSAVVVAPDFDVQIVRQDLDSGSPNLEFSLSGQAPKLLSMHAAAGRHWITLNQSGDSLKTTSSTPLSSIAGTPNYYNYNRGDSQDQAVIYAQAELPLVLRDLNATSDSPGQQIDSPKGLSACTCLPRCPSSSSKWRAVQPSARGDCSTSSTSLSRIEGWRQAAVARSDGDGLHQFFVKRHCLVDHALHGKLALHHFRAASPMAGPGAALARGRECDGPAADCPKAGPASRSLRPSRSNTRRRNSWRSRESRGPSLPA